MTHRYPPITLLLVENHAAAREVLAARLRLEPDIEVVAVASSFVDALASVTRHEPDIAIIDGQVATGDPLLLCWRLQQLSPATRCIIHATTLIDPWLGDQRVASAVVLKQLMGETLLGAIRQVAIPPL